jgi:hypothetical protein
MIGTEKFDEERNYSGSDKFRHTEMIDRILMHGSAA